jgi:NTP pyrophosphatase (non-canonical NTP hydrolase)
MGNEKETQGNQMRETLKKLVHEIDRAKKIHPKPTMMALVEEVGEVAKAAQEEGPDRLCEELLQVACVAIRLHEYIRNETDGTKRI